MILLRLRTTFFQKVASLGHSHTQLIKVPFSVKHFTHVSGMPGDQALVDQKLISRPKIHWPIGRRKTKTKKTNKIFEAVSCQN